MCLPTALLEEWHHNPGNTESQFTMNGEPFCDCCFIISPQQFSKVDKRAIELLKTDMGLL